MLRSWQDLPEAMKNEEVYKYYTVLRKKKYSLFFKRIFDIIIALLMLITLSPLFIVLAIAIKVESKGAIFYRQTRITQYGKTFKIFKFRTMAENADQAGKLITTAKDSRITRVGRIIRRLRLDETSQLFDVLRGSMTFVGTRPEVPLYVRAYDKKMLATLLLPAGITSLASIYYKDEAKLLEDADDIEKTYIEEVLPGKMYYNLKAIEEFSFWGDIKIMFMTVLAVLGKEYKGDYVRNKDTYSLESNIKETV